MNDLLWFSGITWHTPMRDIGWTYVAMLILGGVAIHFIGKAMKP